MFRVHLLLHILLGLAQSLLHHHQLLNNPIPDPCQLPDPPSPDALSPFCQLHYHQIPYICDPAGMLSRTEAELIDRRLHRLSGSVNVTGCLCQSDSSSVQTSEGSSLSRCSHPAWKDKKLGQLRVAVLLVPQASINGIRKCAKSLTDAEAGKGRHNNNNDGAESSGGFSAATAQFARGTLKRLMSGEQPRERCDPDLLIVYIREWTSNNVQMPFVARLFRRNLAHLAHESQVERIDIAETGAFEVLSEQLTRALQLGTPSARHRTSSRHASQPPASMKTTTLVPILPIGSIEHFQTPPNAAQIPLWAILSATALLSLVLLAILLAHWVSKHISVGHQKKGCRLLLNGSMRAAGSLRRQDGTNGPKISSASHSVTFATEKGEKMGGNGGGGGGHHHHQMKGSMMFRQFSRRHRRAAGAAPQQQKI